MVEHAYGMTGGLTALLTLHYTAPYLIFGIGNPFGFLQALAQVGSDILDFIRDPPGTILSWILPDYVDLGHLLGWGISQEGQNGNDPAAQALYDVAQKAGFAMVGVAVAGRAAKMALARDNTTPGVILVDTAVRAVIAAGLIYAGYDILWNLFLGSCHIGGALLDGFVNAQHRDSWFQETFKGGDLAFIPKIVAILMTLYLLFVIIGTKILFWFTVSIAPLVVPIWAFGSGKVILDWWIKTMLGALLAPMVAGAGAGVTFAFAQAFSQGWPFLGSIAAVFILAAGFYYTGSMLRHMCSSAFEMGGVLVGTAVLMIKATQEAFKKVAQVGAVAATGGAGAAAMGAEGAAAGGAEGGGMGMPLMGGDGPLSGLITPGGGGKEESKQKGMFRDILSSPAGQKAMEEDGPGSLIDMAGGDSNDKSSGYRMRIIMAAATGGGGGGTPNAAVVTKLGSIQADNLATPSSYAEEMAMETAQSGFKVTDKRG